MRNHRPFWGFVLASLALLATSLPHSVPVMAQSRHALTTPEKLPALPKHNFSSTEQCSVIDVVDGRTILVAQDSRVKRIRLLGVTLSDKENPSNDVRPYSKEAFQFLSNLLRGEEVYVITEAGAVNDDNGLVLAHVFRAPDGFWVNLELVRQGYVQVCPDELRQNIDLFLPYELNAKKAQKGLWKPSLKVEQPSTPGSIPTSTRPAEKPADEVKPTPEKITVYVTRTGTKYHRASCSYLRSSSIPMDLSNAKRRFTPCSRCHPPS